MKLQKLHTRQIFFFMIALFIIGSGGIIARAESVTIDVTNPPESVTGPVSPYDNLSTPKTYPIKLEAEEDKGIVGAILNNYTVSGATPGSKITLQAYAKPGYRFAGWTATSDKVKIDEENNTFTMPEEEVNIQAKFEKIEESSSQPTENYTITIENSTFGDTIAQLRDDNGDSISSAPAGSNILLFQIPKEGYRFTGWTAVLTKKITPSSETSGTTPDTQTETKTETIELLCNGNSIMIPTEEPTEGTVTDRVVTITANYSPLTENTLKISSAKHGSLTAMVNNTTATSAKEGTQVTLLPKPSDTYRLDTLKVTSSNGEVKVDNLTFTMPNSEVTIKATYTRTQSFYIANGQDTNNDRNAIQKALNTQNGNDPLTVYIPEGTYYIDEQLRIRSNTTLQLAPGAVIKRTDDSGLLHNMIMTCQIIADANGDISYRAKSTGGYDLAQNIIIEGGTWDGGNISKATDPRNLFNIGHSSNVIIRNTTIKNCYGSHLIEFAGSKDCQVYNCTFTGFRKGNGKDSNGTAVDVIDSEAIQLDVCYTPDGKTSWNDAFLDDKTTCKNIQITNNSFIDYPGAVGNHHQLSGYHNENIVISNNTMRNTINTSVPAVYLYGFDDSKVEHNTISGYSVGIKANNSVNSNISDNAITSCSTYGIHFTGSSSGKIVSNAVTNTKRNGIYADAGANISSISKNELTKVGTSSGHSGIWITGSSTVAKTISKNQISGAKEYGINVTSGASVTNIKSNTVSDIKKSGIVVKNAGKKVTVKSNTLRNIKGTYAIKIDNTSKKAKQSYSVKIKTTPLYRKKGNITVSGKNLKKATLAVGSKKYNKNFKKEKATITHKKISASKAKKVTLTVTDKNKNVISKTLTAK